MAANNLMAGKRGLIMGVANERSIAWGIAQTLADAGAELAFTYQGHAFKKRVEPIVAPQNPAALMDCDVTNQGSLDAVFAELGAKWDSLDFVVHAIAFSDRERTAQGPLRRYDRRQTSRRRSEHILLLVHCGRAARGEDDAQWRLDGDAVLLWRRESDAAL